MKNTHALIMDMTPQFTSSERKIANVILADYPFTALRSIQELAHKTGVGVRLHHPLRGWLGYEGFQRHLINELQEWKRSPRPAGGSLRT